MKRGGFGAIDREHGRMFLGLIQDTEGRLDRAEQVLRGGDCRTGIEATLAAERYFGEARGHYADAPRAVRLRTQKRYQEALRRLNFLQQALQRCVR